MDGGHEPGPLFDDEDALARLYAGVEAELIGHEATVADGLARADISTMTLQSFRAWAIQSLPEYAEVFRHLSDAELQQVYDRAQLPRTE